MLERKPSGLKSLASVALIFSIVGGGVGVLVGIEPRIGAIVALPLGLMGYALGTRLKQGKWLLVFAGLLLFSLVSAMLTSLLVGVLREMSVTNLTVLTGLNVFLFVVVLLSASLIFFVGSLLDWFNRTK